MNDNNKLFGKRIMVTGAGSGIGKAIACSLAASGAEVILVGRSEEKLAKTKELLTGTNHLAVTFDLFDFDHYDELFKICASEKLDGLVHCAGIAKAIPLRTLSVNSLREMLDIHYTSFVFLVKNFVKKSNSNDGASVVFCSTTSAHECQQKCMEIYESSKLAAEGFVRGIASELYKGRKDRINAMVIGPVATPMAGFEDGDISCVGTQSEICPNLMGIGSTEPVTNMALFLLGGLSEYSTGRIFYVDGGVGLNAY